MNERIKALAEQATKRYPATESSGEFSTFDKEKFAELIVRECATFIDSHEQIDKYGEAQDTVYGKDLLQHFGVEE